MKHTKGPWRFDGAFIRANHRADDEGNAIYAEVAEVTASFTAEGKANAHLIAAAPELLEALSDIVIYAMNGNYAVQQEQAAQEAGANTCISELLENAKTAIAKAEGNSK